MGHQGECLAKIVDVEVGSPAYDAGFEPGCFITSVDGNPIRDMIDWRWHTSDDVIEVGYIDLDGDAGTVVLERELGQDWGLAFDGAVFDGVRTCRNACTFCFMRQLPSGMRSSLSIRDDDYRLSFLEGTFSTFTNVGDDDIARIIEQRITPLRISLHAVDQQVRRRLIGRHEAEGMAAFERLMSAGIDFDVQIVLVPGENDGAVLDETLEWAYAHPRIRNAGVVPLGFTSHQGIFDKSFDDPEDALHVIEQIRPFQVRSEEERGFPWAYAADEFYCNAYGEDVLEHLPDASFYGDFSMFEDGIGIVRSAVDSWDESKARGDVRALADALKEKGVRVAYICGEAMRSYAPALAGSCGLFGLFDFHFAENGFFGGNVNVTGLLCGCDIAKAANGAVALCRAGSSAESSAPNGAMPRTIIAIPDVVFNDDDVTLDDWTLDDIKGHVGEDSSVHVLRVSSNPLDYIRQISEFASALGSRI